MKKFILIISIFLLSSLAFSQLKAEITTSKGTIQIQLYAEQSPLAAANFVNLAMRGYYDNTKVHRVVADLAIQMGDPSGTGRGGPGYTFPDELNNGLKHNAAGIISMVNTGPNTNGSQFFICTNPIAWYDGKHTIFAKVVSGLDVVRKLSKNDLIKSIKITGEIPKAVKDQKAKIDKWNKILDSKFPNLKPAPNL